MENKKDLETTINVFLTEENDVKKDNSTEEENKIVQEKCTTEECRMKNRDSIIERVNKVFITEDGRQLLTD